MKENVHATVAALIEKAADERTNIDEARNAALQACRLIHRYSLLKSPAPLRSRGFAGTPRQNMSESMFADIMDELFGNTPRESAPPPAPTPPQPTPSPPMYRRIDPDDPNRKFVPIVDKPAYCGICMQRILRGKFAMWSKSEFFHKTCWDTEAKKYG